MTETPLKPGWTKVKFGEVVRLCKDRSSNPEADGIERYVGLEHLEPEDLRIRSWGLVAEGTTFTSRFKPGQVLFGKRRAYQRKVAVADFEGVCSGDIYVLESSNQKHLLPELLPFICQSENFFDYAIATSAGSLSPRTNWKSLKNFELALPPLDEQVKIVQPLKIALSSLEEKLHLLEKGRNLTDSLRNSLVRGLNEETPHTIPLPKLKIKVPENWQVINMGKCLSLLKDGGHLPPKRSDQNGPMLLSVSHVNNGTLTYSDEERRVDWEYYKSIHKKWSILPGDVLLGIIGTVGRTARVPENMPPFTLQRMVAVLRGNPDLLTNDYLYTYLNSDIFQRYCWSRVRYTAQPALYLSEISEISIPVPPLETQKKISEAVEAVVKSNQKIEFQIANDRAKLNAIKEMFRLG